LPAALAAELKTQLAAAHAYAFIAVHVGPVVGLDQVIDLPIECPQAPDGVAGNVATQRHIGIEALLRLQVLVTGGKSLVDDKKLKGRR